MRRLARIGVIQPVADHDKPVGVCALIAAATDR